MSLKIKSVAENEFVQAGRIRRAFGIRGQLAVDWNNGSSPVSVGKGIIFMQDGESKVQFTLLEDKKHGNHNIISVKGLESRNDAERFRGFGIWVEKNKLPSLKSGEYYCYQLIEMRVESIHGEYLGEIAEILSTGSNDVYVVRKGEKEILVPATDEVVKSIDLEKGLMKIEIIEGLV